VVQRLLRRRHARGMEACGHWFDARAFAGQQQFRTIRVEWRGTIRMAKCCSDRLDISREP
jgi:hypothetical protein